MTRNFCARTIGFTLTTVGFAAAAALTAPAAGATPGAGGNAQDVINSIKAQGDQVVITTSGTKPLSQCVVTSVRQDSAVYGLPPNSAYPGNSRVLKYRTFHVDVKC